ncbi:uncharacterized protein KY384_004287 [Bacidia gigantensis]|uniref:uncharacterized protein n=1 Tax=Bacidia gigantensis TaxID=2732470 RepID=UPI001D03974E|nr:uncharacterized protein KY384_004287 [Bacidia gigantensis]KAG8530930.1 hypothetical protein KY384_004287 [Bacidia gigantensis]
MEQTANNNPTSASAQNAFYSALLRADMPNIVVERFQTGRYASSEACENTYQKALEKTVRAESNGAIPGIQRGNMSGTLSEEQSRNIGVSTVAQMYGAAGAKVLPGSTGQKQSPIHVVIEESRGASVFRWVKFFVTYAIYGYLVFVLVSLVLEMSGMLRRPGAIPNADAQLQQQKVRFSDVHGCEEAKDELQELVEFLKNPERFTKLGGKLPKGVLLVGPPGTGKTMLARAVAGEAGVPFYYMSGSEFDEIYVGVGAKRVRELFATARAKAPAIVFIDELDAIGAKRNERDPVYVKQSLNQLLTELDGFSQETGVIILGATNFPQLLDKALTRPGRFDRKVQVSLPDVRGRLQILKHYLKKIKAENNLDESVIARGTSGFSGAELESLVNQAAVHASRNGAPAVSMPDLDWAKDKIMMGAERRSAIIKDEHKLLTAYHEAGHALVGLYTKGTDPVYKITIMPRGQALGVTYFMPEMDKDYGNYSRAELLAKLDVAMGGKAAEQIVYGEDNVTMGCGMDISNATTIAHQMVTQGGMSTTLGNMDLANWKALSPDTAAAIEKEVRSMLEDARDRAAKILDEKRNELDLLAKALIECESLDLDEMMKAIKGEKIEKMKIMKGVGIKLPEIVLPPGIGTGQTAGGAGSEASRQGSNERTGDGEGSEAEIPRKVNVA